MSSIILIGFMGSGKTSLGIRLSYRLRRTMTDTDYYIEQKEGRSIAEIFAKEGEEAFRRLETECLKRLIREGGEQIISTGGGLALREENRRLLRRLGVTVYLRARPETIYERLKNDTSRPLIQTRDPEKSIRELLKERAPVYEAAAERIVDVDGRDFETVLEEIVSFGILEEGEGADEDTCD